MTGKFKLIAVVAVGLLALVAGEYLSGFVLLRLTQETRVPLDVSTYWRYFQVVNTEEFQSYALKIKLSGAIGFGLPYWPGRRLRYGYSSPKRNQRTAKPASPRFPT